MLAEDREAVHGLRSRRASGYETERPDVQRHVPAGARRILDIGCSAGALGEALKRHDAAEVVGIELAPEYAREAAERLDAVIVGEAGAVLCAADAPARLGSFDCVIAADVLEHLVDPFAALSCAANLLEEGGTAIVSLPNARFWQLLWQLAVRGRWPRADSGLFDRTHLQWFTRADAVRLLEQAGLRVVEVEGRYKLNYVANKVDRVLGPLLARLPVRSFFAYQYLLVGVRESESAPRR